MPKAKPSDLRLVRAGAAEHAGAFAAIQVATPAGRLRRIDLTECEALLLASTLLLIAAEHARTRQKETSNE